MARIPLIRSVRRPDFRIALMYPAINIKVETADMTKAALKPNCSETDSNKM